MSQSQKQIQRCRFDTSWASVPSGYIPGAFYTYFFLSPRNLTVRNFHYTVKLYNHRIQSTEPKNQAQGGQQVIFQIYKEEVPTADYVFPYQVLNNETGQMQNFRNQIPTEWILGWGILKIDRIFQDNLPIILRLEEDPDDIHLVISETEVVLASAAPAGVGAITGDLTTETITHPINFDATGFLQNTGGTGVDTHEDVLDDFELNEGDYLNFTGIFENTRDFEDTPIDTYSYIDAVFEYEIVFK